MQPTQKAARLISNVRQELWGQGLISDYWLTTVLPI